MRSFVSLLGSAAIATAGVFTGAPAAVAQQYSNYGEDPCEERKDKAGQNGAIAGAMLGGMVGLGASDRKNKTENAILGALIGGLAGRQIGRSQVRCAPYPPHLEARRNCRWVYEGVDGFEICQGRDGVWRPSGRA